ncbi:MAG: hypothetical protein ACOY31_06300 [Bacillota bacterium]
MPEFFPAGGLWVNVLFFLSGWLSCRLMLPGIVSIIKGAGFLRPNYRGSHIPAGLGLFLLPSCLMVLVVFFLFMPEYLRARSAVFMFALSFFTLLGLADDCWGNKRCRGMAGHLASLFKGNPTTGSIKALGGGAGALFIAMLISRNDVTPLTIALHALTVALSVNAVNLFDLRPGRAAKFFLLLAIPMIVIYQNRPETIFASLAAGSLLAYLPLDLGGEGMMGDAGSNSLGAVLGITAIMLFDNLSLSIFLFIILALNVLAERVSFTRVIASSRILDFIDRLGTKT